MSEWNEAIDAAIELVDRLGADRPKPPIADRASKEGRFQAMNQAQHTRARTIRRGLEGLKR